MTSRPRREPIKGTPAAVDNKAAIHHATPARPICFAIMPYEGYDDIDTVIRESAEECQLQYIRGDHRMKPGRVLPQILRDIRQAAVGDALLPYAERVDHALQKLLAKPLGSELAWMRRLGVTKVQMGAQSLDDRILALNQRGHTAAHIPQPTQEARTTFWPRCA